jgi:hypothetical protein
MDFLTKTKRKKIKIVTLHEGHAHAWRRSRLEGSKLAEYNATARGMAATTLIESEFCFFCCVCDILESKQSWLRARLLIVRLLG